MGERWKELLIHGNTQAEVDKADKDSKRWPVRNYGEEVDEQTGKVTALLVVGDVELAEAGKRLRVNEALEKMSTIERSNALADILTAMAKE